MKEKIKKVVIYLSNGIYFHFESIIDAHKHGQMIHEENCIIEIDNTMFFSSNYDTPPEKDKKSDYVKAMAKNYQTTKE